MSSDMFFPERPAVVTLGASLLFACAAILLVAWVVQPQSVTSNGGQVFFMVLWTWLGWSAWSGLGWVRVAILIVVAAFLWGLINAESMATALAGSSVGDLASKIVATVAVVLLYSPTAHAWFQQLADDEEPDGAAGTGD